MTSADISSEKQKYQHQHIFDMMENLMDKYSKPKWY